MAKKPDQLYVIGPITGFRNNNRYEFERVRGLLERYSIVISDLNPDGVKVWDVFVDIPHDFVGESEPWEICMMKSLHEITSTYLTEDEYETPYTASWYDGIAMLDGWEESRGARIEHDLATALGIPCKPYREWLELLQ